jgi:hypothetical protein
VTATENQSANSIVISALGNGSGDSVVIGDAGANTLVISPIRAATGTSIMMYGAGNEVTHGTAIPGYTNTADLKALVAASADFADYQTRIAAL